MNTPLYNKLIDYSAKNRISFAMPGHKGNVIPNLLRLDVTELPQTADLHDETDAVKAANDELSRLYGTQKSYILTSGSTTAILAMLLSCTRPGDTVLVSEDCHMSVINACVLSGASIAVMEKGFDDIFLIPTWTLEFEEYFKKYTNIKAVIITSPSYYGICEDVEKIYEVCKKHNALLLVDEAHGAHFISNPKFPKSAVNFADMVCHSAHKTLKALTGAAYLHICSDRVDPQKVRRAINMVETSSPSYPIAVSADIAREMLCHQNREACIKKCRELSQKLSDLGIQVLSNDDPTRLVINFKNFNMTGFYVSDMLSLHYGIDVEMADMLNIVLIVTPYNIDTDFDELYNSLLKIIKTGDIKITVPKIDKVKHNTLINPRDAYFSDSFDIDFKNSKGHISRATVVAYPPGTPIIIIGERIGQQQIDLTEKLKLYGAKIQGLNDNKIEVVKE
ncbi:MAG: aminotransferase class I/II-fold pyridoxal phosphate-dependent enzyme [Clostridia bacterium]|nr:aminotransferase class I/II-fold pyridoxal phosphate-dependent enzyme [Clostridia bacterium]